MKPADQDPHCFSFTHCIYIDNYEIASVDRLEFRSYNRGVHFQEPVHTGDYAPINYQVTFHGVFFYKFCGNELSLNI